MRLGPAGLPRLVRISGGEVGRARPALGWRRADSPRRAKADLERLRAPHLGRAARLRPVRSALRRRLGIGGVAHALPAGPAIDAPDVLVPLERVDGRSAERLSHLLWEQLESRADPHVLEGATEGLIELVGNALEHSGRGQAIVMAQVYARGEAPDHDDRLQVVIGDVGRGIRESFLAGPEHRPADDRTAIDLALTYQCRTAVAAKA